MSDTNNARAKAIAGTIQQGKASLEKARAKLRKLEAKGDTSSTTWRNIVIDVQIAQDLVGRSERLLRSIS